MSYSPYTKLRFMCHCDTNTNCEWCNGKGFYYTSELTIKDLEKIKDKIEIIINNRR